MTYCIYCGARLPKITPPQRVRVPPAPTRIPPAPPPRPIPPRPPSAERAPSPPTVKISPPPVTAPEVKNEVLSLMSDITKYYERKISLLGLFSSGEVSERVLLKLYDEYTNKLTDLLKLRARKLDELKNDLEAKSKRLDDIKMAIEELQVRHKIGEVNTEKFNERINMLRMEEDRLQNTLKELEMNIDHLGKMLAEKPPREILNLDRKTRSCYDTLAKLAEEGKITNETLDKIKSDTDNMLEFFNSLIGGRKEKERTLREQLETLQARYRVSEISIEEYERKKREIQEEIDKVWT